MLVCVYEVLLMNRVVLDPIRDVLKNDGCAYPDVLCNDAVEGIDHKNHLLNFSPYFLQMSLSILTGTK